MENRLGPRWRQLENCTVEAVSAALVRCAVEVPLFVEDQRSIRGRSVRAAPKAVEYGFRLAIRRWSGRQEHGKHR
jgi:hypothetical protein